MKVLNGRFPSLEQAATEYLEKSHGGEPISIGSKSFAEVLAARKTENTQLKFSKHAEGRLAERNIKLDEGTMNRLSAGAKAAGQKGINESLVMVDQLAFIVNIKNQTVITALDGSDSEGNVFTNIDGAVIA